MSSHPAIRTPSDPVRLPMTLPLLTEKKRLGEPIVMVTAYDYPSARAAEAGGVDLVLVGRLRRHHRARLQRHHTGGAEGHARARPCGAPRPEHARC